MVNRVDPRTDPWGTPQVTEWGRESPSQGHILSLICEIGAEPCKGGSRQASEVNEDSQ